METAYIVDIIRTPVGRYGGALSSVRPDDSAAHVIKGLVERNNSLPQEKIEDVIFGAANQAGEDNRNVSRMVVLLAGLPNTIGGVTVNRLCVSQEKYWQADAQDKFSNELLPMSIPQRKSTDKIVDTDEHPRKTSLEKLATLKPAFKESGTVTAGNSSGINDGAAADLLVNEETLNKYNLQPLVKVVSMAITGVNPDIMGVGVGQGASIIYENCN